MAATTLHPMVLQSAFVRRSTPLKKYLIGSGIAHVGVVAFALVWNLINRGPAIDLNQQPIHATLVRRGKPRDEKLLPRKEEEPPPPPEKIEGAPKPPEPVETKPAIPVPIPGVKPQQSQARQDGVKSSAAERRKALFGAFGKVGKKPTTEELEGAADGDENGDSATQEGERYDGQVGAQVRRFYDVSQTIPDQERIHLMALVSVRIGRDGHVLRVQLAKSSGNDLFDNAVLSAVKKAQPFPPPPDHLRAAYEAGVTLQFKP